MALRLRDRIRETTTTTGTGTIDLDGAVSGFQTFVTGAGDGNTCFYVIENGTDWEIGTGTVTDATPDTLSRDTIHASSNGGSAVDWGVGTKNVFLTLPANVMFLNGAVLRPAYGGTGLDNSSATGFAFFSGGSGSTSAAATQAEQETATSLTKPVTPGRQHHHPSAAKFWVNFSPVGGTGSATVNASYNTTSVSDDGTGDFTVTIGTDFSSGNWSPQATAVTGGQNHIASCGTIAAGTIDITCFDVNANQVDPSVVSVQGFGDQ